MRTSETLKMLFLWLPAGLLFLLVMLYEKYFAKMFRQNDYDAGEEFFEG